MSQPILSNMEYKFTYTLDNNDLKPIEVSFRDIIPEITNTSYLTHSIYYYPAKFIPQVVRFCINEFTKKGDTIIDPFAGSGTVGLESFITERNAILLDLNYLLEIIVPIKIYKGNNEISKITLNKIIEVIKKETTQYLPDYSNIRYWYPDEIFEIISRYWDGTHKLDNNIYKWIIQASLVRLSKLFSWAEHRTPKLFKSKFKKKYMEELLNTNWKKDLDKKLFSLSYKYFDAVKQMQRRTKGHNNNIVYYAGIDSAKFRLENTKEIDALITSPPYLQAQEYIRTSKLDLYWLGYTEKQIKEISKLEIPYRKVERIINTETLEINREGFRKYIKSLKNEYEVIKVPE